MSRATKDVVQQIQINRQQSQNGQQQLRGGADPRPQQRRPSYGADSDALGGSALPTYNPAPPASRVAAATPPSENDLYNQLKAKVEQQRVELTQRTDNVNAIQRNFQRLSEMYATDRQRMEEAEARLKAALEELEALRSEKKVLEALKKEFAALRQRCSMLEKEQGEGTAALQGELLELRRHVADVTAERDMMQRAVAECGDRIQFDEALRERLAAGLARAEGEVGSLFSAIRDLYEASGAESNDGIGSGGGGGFAAFAAAKPDGKGSLELRMDFVVRAISVCSQRGVYPLVTKCGEALRRVAEEGAANLNRALGERDAVKQELASSRAERDALQRSLDEAQLRCRDLATRLCNERAELQSRIDALEAGAEAAAGDVDQRVAAERSATAAALADLSAARARSEELAAEIAVLKRQRDDFEAQAARGVEALRTEQEAARARAAKDAEVIAAAEKTAAGLRKQLSDAEAQRSSQLAQQKAALEQRIAALEAELKTRPAADAAAAALKAALDAQRTAEGALESERAALAALRRDHEKILKDLSECNAAKTALSARCDQLLKSVEEANARLAALQSALDLAQGAESRLRSELTAAEADAARAKSERNEALSALRAVEQRRLEQEIALQVAQKELGASGAANAKLATAQETIGALQASIAGLRAELTCEQQRLEAERQKVADLRTMKDRAETAARDAKKFSDELLASQESILKQRLELEQRSVAAAERASQIRLVQEETAKAVKKLINAEQACESGYSCQNCMELLKNPVICAPCGHCFCSGCAPKRGGACGECERQVDAVIPAKNLDLLSGKFAYRVGVLNDLLTMVEKELAKPAPSMA